VTGTMAMILTVTFSDNLLSQVKKKKEDIWRRKIK
jgi:hypothetical protein